MAETSRPSSPIPGANNPDEPKTSAAVITVYKAKIAGTPRNVTVSWNKTLINHTLSFSVSPSPSPSTCRVDLKPWPFWTKKGFKSLEIGDQRLTLFWDLRSAKFSAGGCPEPTARYYVALVSGEEVVLLLGDCKKEAYRRAKARPSLEEARMVSKRENVFGKRCFSTRVRFDGGKREHRIVVENSKDAEMWISVDGVVVIRVSNLQWKFRGNETVMVEGEPVQVYWDVHDWMFRGAGMGQALFMFKPGEAAEVAVVEKEEDERRSDFSWTSENEGGEVVAVGEERSGGASGFCFLLYAWKVEK